MEEMCSKTLSFIDNLGIDKDKISFVCFSISGRIDTNAGISHSAFNFEGDDTPLAETLSEKTGLRVIIENNTRAMTFGELSLYNKDSLKNFLLVNVNWGLGLGIVLNGEVYCGSNGYAGEFGHMNVYNNEIICHCGKKGCLETEVSGMAMQRHLTERIKNGEASILRNRIANGNELTPSDIISAIRSSPSAVRIAPTFSKLSCTSVTFFAWLYSRFFAASSATRSRSTPMSLPVVRFRQICSE